MNKSNRGFLAAAFACLTFMLVVGSTVAQASAPQLKTRNVVLIVSDGLRWQEIIYRR